MFSYKTQRHAFHLVDPSIMPLLTAIAFLSVTLSSVLYFHGFSIGFESTLFSFFCLLLAAFV
jgi:hypothetical protein